LSVDFGERRVGIAISDPLGVIAQPLPTIEVKSNAQLLRDLGEIIQKKAVVRIVVGMPLNLKGERGKTAQAVEKFVRQLRKKAAVPVEIWDERFTSVVAEQTIRAMGKSPSRHKGKIDQISAQLILQNYLDAKALRR